MEKTMEQEMELVLYTYRVVRKEYGLPRTRDTLLRVPVLRTIVFMVSLLGFPYFGFPPPYCAPHAGDHTLRTSHTLVASTLDDQINRIQRLLRSYSLFKPGRV